MLIEETPWTVDSEVAMFESMNGGRTRQRVDVYCVADTSEEMFLLGITCVAFLKSYSLGKKPTMLE